MKKTIIIFLLITCITTYVFSQSYKFALFNNTQIDADSSVKSLIEKVKIINNIPGIKFVIFQGNITAHGSLAEFDLAKSIFDSLTVPYYLLPGSKDIENSQTKGADYKLDFKQNHFVFEFDSTYHIGIRTTTYDFNNIAHISPEEIKWLMKTVKTIQDNKKIIIHLNHPLRRIDNARKLKNVLADRYLNIIAGNNNAGFNFIAVQNDTIFANNPFPNASLNSFSIHKEYFIYNDSMQFIDYSFLRGEKIPKIKAKIIWNKELNTETPGNILIGKDRLFLIGRNGVIYCMDYKGKTVWTNNLNEEIIGKPALIKDILIVASAEGDLLTIKAATGEVIQSIGIDDALVTTISKIKINYYGEETDAVIVGSGNGTFYCYTLNKLELVWSNNLSETKIVTEPLIIKHRLIFGSSDGYLYSIDDRTGVLYWKWKPKKIKDKILNFSNPLSDGNNIYVSASDGVVYKIDLLLGTTLWKAGKYKANLSLGLSSTGRTVIIKTTRGKIILLYSKTGIKYRNIKLKFGKDVLKHTPIEWKGNFIISSDVGKVYLIDKKYKHKPLFFLGNAALNSVQKISENEFIISNVDGKIILFSLQ
ncbi:MAG: PQQ-binding-like beta-propeller repeat protein [Bacteroidetes bacterium]|nr:PQQ-binding-like beta-propeller repeat protein [Bacteroidota bacterium]